MMPIMYLFCILLFFRKKVPFLKASKSISDFKWFQSASWGVTNWLNKCVFSVTSWGKRDDGRKERDLCKYVLLKYINCKGYILYHNSLDRESLFAIIWLKTYLLPKVLVTLFKTRPAGNLAEKQVGLPMVSPGRPWAAP